jgi:hypothetical protein
MLSNKVVDSQCFEGMYLLRCQCVMFLLLRMTTQKIRIVQKFVDTLQF